MKLLTLNWIEERRSSGLIDHLASEWCAVGSFRACVGSNEQPNRYTFPYKLAVSSRTHPEHTYHTTVADAKRQATEELSEAVHKMCTELGYILPQ
jgi:hypothetical protein